MPRCRTGSRRRRCDDRQPPRAQPRPAVGDVDQPPHAQPGRGMGRRRRTAGGAAPARRVAVRCSAMAPARGGDGSIPCAWLGTLAVAGSSARSAVVARRTAAVRHGDRVGTPAIAGPVWRDRLVGRGPHRTRRRRAMALAAEACPRPARAVGRGATASLPWAVRAVAHRRPSPAVAFGRMVVRAGPATASSGGRLEQRHAPAIPCAHALGPAAVGAMACPTAARPARAAAAAIAIPTRQPGRAQPGLPASIRHRYRPAQPWRDGLLCRAPTPEGLRRAERDGSGPLA